MKVNVEIDCTPAEARAWTSLGLQARDPFRKRMEAAARP